MEGKPTYDLDAESADSVSRRADSPRNDEPEPRPVYTVDSYSAVATASMPSKPFHERQDENNRGKQRP